MFSSKHDSGNCDKSYKLGPFTKWTKTLCTWLTIIESFLYKRVVLNKIHTCTIYNQVITLYSNKFHKFQLNLIYYQFCCRSNCSSSSADRYRKAADSRYPAMSCLIVVISVELSWFFAEFFFKLKSVGPE